MKKKKSFSKLYLYGAIGCIAVIAIVGYIYCFSSFSKSSNTEYVYIDSDDNIDSVYNKLRPFAKSIPFQAFKTLTSIPAMPIISAPADTPLLRAMVPSRHGAT